MDYSDVLFFSFPASKGKWGKWGGKPIFYNFFGKRLRFGLLSF